MKIRWKILLILLAFSLLPLLVLRVHSVQTLKELGKDLQSRTRITLLDRTVEDLKHLSNSIADIVNLEGRLYSTSLKSIQIRSEQLLSESVQAGRHFKPFIISGKLELNRPALHPDDNYKKLNITEHIGNQMSGNQMFKDILISKNDLAYWLPEGLTPQDVRTDIYRLAPILELFKSCDDTLKDLVLWLEINMESGLTVAFPAHNSFPKLYDARQNSWYRKVKRTREAGWSLPMTDPTTSSLVHRMTAPILDQSNDFIGAVSIVVPVDSPIDQEAVTRFTGEMHIFLVSTNIAQRNKDKLLIVGEYWPKDKENPEKLPMGHFWQAPDRDKWLYETTPEFSSLISDIEESRAGVMQMPYRGVNSLWTFNPVSSGLSILLVTPTESFTKQADDAEQYVRLSISNHISTVTIIFIVTISALILAAYIISLYLATPIRKISAAVNKVAKGDWEARVDLNYTDELGELADTFNKMVPQLKERSSILQALSLADEAQKNFFPARLTEFENVDMAASCIFSEKTGGDYFDFVGSSICGKNRFATSIGDVSGHGIAAALLMTTARAYIRALSGPNKLIDIITKTNRLLAKDCASSSNFITMMTVVCDIDNMRLNWVRAGHDPALLYSTKDDTFTELIGSGLALGIDPEFQYRENSIKIKSGQVLILYTDGIWEAHSPAGVQFGKDRILSTIRDNWDKPAEEIVKIMQANVINHCAGLPTEDDCTVIVVKFL